MDYPKREPFFAMRFLRLLTKSAAAMEIGSEGVALLMVIVSQEDACRYSRPVNFWNAQLATLCGIPAHNESQLRRVRDRCVKAGWLAYEGLGRRKYGVYAVAIPANINQDNDGSCDESPGDRVRQSGANPAPSVRNVCADDALNVRNVCAECAPSIPNPLPNPLPKSAAAPPPGPKIDAAADPMGEAFEDVEQANPAPRRAIPPLSFADWRIQVGKRIFWTRDEDETWRALFDAEGWDEMSKAYEHLAKTYPAPKKLFLSMFQEIRE